MLPYKERPSRNYAGGGEVPDSMEHEPDGHSDIHQIAFRGVAHDLMNAFRNQDVQKVTEALQLLCELCISTYDRD